MPGGRIARRDSPPIAPTAAEPPIVRTRRTRRPRPERDARRIFGRIVVVGPVAVVAGRACRSPSRYPARPIRLVVAQPPGGHSDAIGRIVGPKLAEILQQPVVIDNRGGAGGTIGAEVVARAPRDGYTLLLGGSNNLAIAVAMTERRALRPACGTSCRSAASPPCRMRSPSAPAFPPRRWRSCWPTRAPIPDGSTTARAASAARRASPSNGSSRPRVWTIVHVPYRVTAQASSRS